ncbi:hypothetical protein RND71_012445 [Anisodus tanguticus]|uniref:50S ribosomal protein L5, chloroplastic n=1 Tax=Anisodus tanguticus TaxID=243964 RepID=A0AAE1SD95_9SOLA|nr:hypothetical protein RND71_012445 [Anisodus tanguticus]
MGNPCFLFIENSWKASAAKNKDGISGNLLALQRGNEALVAEIRASNISIDNLVFGSKMLLELNFSVLKCFVWHYYHLVPKVENIVVNCGIGDAAQNSKGLDAAMNDLALITGQKPVKTRAKNAIATFKIREGQPLGIAVTLRGNVMYSFLDRLINLGLPRTRDFQGVNPNIFDGHGIIALDFVNKVFSHS